MDIDQAHFPRQLLSILKHISTATFVTFDLEMSGINTRQRYGNSDRSLDAGKPTLQQQYSDMKSAAETFQVVQFGLTCVQEDRERGKKLLSYAHYHGDHCKRNIVSNLTP